MIIEYFITNAGFKNKLGRDFEIEVKVLTDCRTSTERHGNASPPLPQARAQAAHDEVNLRLALVTRAQDKQPSVWPPSANADEGFGGSRWETRRFLPRCFPRSAARELLSESSGKSASRTGCCLLAHPGVSAQESTVRRK